MNEPLSQPFPNEDFVVRYEQLRSDALSQTKGISGGFGLTLFFRQGTTAWMRALVQGATPLARKASESWNGISPLPCDVRSQAAVLLAGIILNRQPETTLCKATARR